MINDEMGDFIDDNRDHSMEEVNFYRRLDAESINNYYSFQNQTRDPILAVNIDNIPYYGKEDRQLELFAPVDRNGGEFDKFDEYNKLVKQLKSTLKIFENSENPFFDSTLYGAMHNLPDLEKNLVSIDKEKARKGLGDQFFGELKNIEDEIKLDRTIFGYYDRCFLANEVLSEHGFFLKFFERREVQVFNKKKSSWKK